jgi:nicotinamide mononucleotide transporter
LEAITSIEIIAVLLALVYLVLAAHQNIWCWFAAAISSMLYIKICFDARLYIETGLQFFYFIMAIIGYYHWKKKIVHKESQQEITNLTTKNWLLGILICSALSVLMAMFFQQYTKASLPWLDAPVTIFSIWATWLVIKKVLQNWLLWIAIDALAIYIYVQRHLNFTAMLYALYTMLAILGYYQWKKLQQTSIK